MKKTLWTRNFTLVTVATILGAAGGIAGNFALSFLVYDETKSTLAAALLLALQILPQVVIPMVAAPFMDRLPRKPFLVGGDVANGILYSLAGVYLLLCRFSYVGYLAFSLLLSSLGAFDQLAYNSIYPKLIPAGLEEKGYTISGMIYPVLMVIMTPVASVLYAYIGVGNILLLQGGLSLLAALIEGQIRVKEESRMAEGFSFRQWRQDMKDAASYLKKEKGLRNIYSYMAVTNGVGGSISPILVAFFRTMPGFTIAMYSFFSVAEFAGRSLGGLFSYHVKIPPKKRWGFAFSVYMIYEAMDACLLWLPYPLMLANRSVCGFLGINSATMREAAVQRYIPESYRTRLNAFFSVLISAATSVLTLAVGAMGEILDLRVCLSVCGVFTGLVCLMTIGKNRRAVGKIYNQETQY